MNAADLREADPYEAEDAIVSVAPQNIEALVEAIMRTAGLEPAPQRLFPHRRPGRKILPPRNVSAGHAETGLTPTVALTSTAVTPVNPISWRCRSRTRADERFSANVGRKRP